MKLRLSIGISLIVLAVYLVLKSTIATHRVSPSRQDLPAASLRQSNDSKHNPTLVASASAFLPNDTNTIQSPPLLEILSQNNFKKWKIPALSVADSIADQHEPELIKLFSSETSLSNRFGYLAWMSRHGGDESAKAIIQMITECDQTFQSLQSGDYRVLFNSTFVLGCISSHSEVAREFVKSAINEEFWAATRRWKMPDYCDAGAPALFAQIALQSYGIGGHDDLVDVINALDASEKTTTESWSDVKLCAMAYHYESKRTGPRMFFFLPDEEKVNFYRRWLSTPEAKPWIKKYGSDKQ